MSCFYIINKYVFHNLTGIHNLPFGKSCVIIFVWVFLNILACSVTLCLALIKKRLIGRNEFAETTDNTSRSKCF